MPIVTKFALQEVSPFEISFYRAFLPIYFFPLSFVLTGKSRFLIPKRESLPYIAALGFFGVGIFWILINVGMVYTKAIHSAFLITVYPAMVPLFAPFFLVGKNECQGIFRGDFSNRGNLPLNLKRPLDPAIHSRDDLGRFTLHFGLPLVHGIFTASEEL